MVTNQEEEPVEQVKHTIQLPSSLWADFSSECRKTGITKSEALRKAVWQWMDMWRRLRVEPGKSGHKAVVARTLCIETLHADGTTTYERLIISPY